MQLNPKNVNENMRGVDMKKSTMKYEKIIANIEMRRMMLGMTESEMCIKALMNLRTYQNKKKKPNKFALEEIDRLASALSINSRSLLYGNAVIIDDEQL